MWNTIAKPLWLQWRQRHPLWQRLVPEPTDQWPRQRPTSWWSDQTFELERKSDVVTLESCASVFLHLCDVWVFGLAYWLFCKSYLVTDWRMQWVSCHLTLATEFWIHNIILSVTCFLCETRQIVTSFNLYCEQVAQLWQWDRATGVCLLCLHPKSSLCSCRHCRWFCAGPANHQRHLSYLPGKKNKDRLARPAQPPE